MSDVRDLDKFQDRAQQLLGAIRGMGSSDKCPDLLGSVVINLGVFLRPASMPCVQDPRTRIAVVTHLRRLREGFRNPEWFRENLVDRVGVVFAQLFHRVGDGRLPLHVAPEMAYELFELRLMVSGRRAHLDNGFAAFGLSPPVCCRRLWAVACNG